MKKVMNQFWIATMLILSNQVLAQIDIECENIHGDFESFNTSTVIANDNSWINNSLDNWYVSHGTPSIMVSPTNHMWMWSYGGKGEGVFTLYPFLSGKTYELTYKLWMDATSDPSSQFRVELSNGLQQFNGTSASIPSVGSQSLTTQAWSGTSQWVTITETFTPSQTYWQLWFYPYLAGDPISEQAACRIDDVCIKLHPCERLEDAEIEYTGSNPITFNITGLPDNLYDKLFYHWDLGYGYTASGQTVDHTYYIVYPPNQTSVIQTVCLTIYYFDTESDECCSETICTDVIIGTPSDEGGLVRKGGDEQTPYFESGINYEIDEQRNLGEVKSLEITPSATDGNFQIHTQNEVLINDIVILTLTGKEIYRAKNNGQSDRLTIDLNQYDSGYYLIIVNENDYDNRQVGKVVLK